MAKNRNQDWGEWRLALSMAVWCCCSLARPASASDRTCEPIRIETCRDLGYNVTGMPNLVGHELQQDALLQLQTFTPLIQYGCSSRLRFFLCSVYVPMCTEKVPVPIGPCRSLCEDVRDRCQPVLQEFGFPWPSGLNCSKFPPQNNDKHMCMEGPADNRGTDSTGRSRTRNRRPTYTKSHDSFNGISERTVSKIRPSNHGLCKQFRLSENYFYINRTGRCAALCSADINFSHENKVFADIWVAIWAGLCFLSTLFTLLTFLVDESRFRYPEGAIVFISGCYNVCSIAYFVRLIAGRYESSCHMDSQHDVPILIQEGLDNVNCTIIFVMLYFFGMAAAVWWVVLCVTWFLTVASHWSTEVLERYSTYFHLVAWSLPSIKTITILVMRVVDADELVGSCFVGNQSVWNLLGFVIFPTVGYLFIGTVFLLMGLFAIFRNKNLRQVQEFCHPTCKPERLDALMVRVGIFAGLYIVPAGCVLASYLYEYSWRDQWVTSGSTLRPNVEIFTLKIFMSLVIGFTTGMWMWSSKSPVTTWRKLCQRFSRRKQPMPAYLHMRPQVVCMGDKTKRPIVKTNSETVV